MSNNVIQNNINSNFNNLSNINNTVKNIIKEFEFTEDDEEKYDKIVSIFFKDFSSYISDKKYFLEKLKTTPELYDATGDSNIAKIYEKEGKLFVKSANYENEFDKFFTQVNRYKEQKRKIRQSLKNGSLIYEIPLYKTINLKDLNYKIYEEVTINNENVYEINKIDYYANINNLSKDNKLIFDLNQNSFNQNSQTILILEDKSEINNNIEENEHNSGSNNYFYNSEIMLEISKFDSFETDNICLFLTYLGTNYHSSLIDKDYSRNVFNLNEIIKNIDNWFILDTINYFNNALTPKINILHSFYPQYMNYTNIINSDFDEIKIENNNNNIINKDKSICTNININTPQDSENKNNEKILNEDELVKEIKKYFDEETIKEINKDIKITQNFTHFFIEGRKFNKDNIRKIISFLTKENYSMFAWSFNKDDTKKLGVVNNILKVGNISSKIWFYLNTKKIFH